MRSIGTFLGALALGATAAATEMRTPEPPNAKATLIAEATSARAGETTWIGLRLELPKGWHVYWTNPGDAGLPTRVELETPEGVRAGAPRWPAPERFVTGPVASHGHSGDVLIAVPLEIDESRAPGPARVVVTGSWLLCHDDDGCFPGGARLELVVPISTEAPTAGPHAARFTAARASWPRDASEWVQELTADGASLRLRVEFPADVEFPDPARAAIHFFPHAEGEIEPAGTQRARVDGRVLELVLPRTADRRGAPPAVLSGVLTIRPRGGGAATAFELSASAPAPRES